MAGLTKDQQWKTVIEGLAAGCVAVGASELPSGRLQLEFAFAHAWHSWSWAQAFPSIVARDFRIYLGKSERRAMVTAAFRDGRTVEAYLLPNYEWWGPDGVLDHLEEIGPVPAADWRDLAVAFATSATQRAE